MSQNKKWSAQQKLRIALQALKGDMTISDVCQQYQVCPSQVHAWKKQLLEEGDRIFEKTDNKQRKKEEQQAQKLQQQLFEKIGELTFERDFLKKAWSKLDYPSESS